jgi:O-antigen ligase
MEEADEAEANVIVRALAGIGVCALLILGVALAASRAALLLAPFGVLLALPAAAALRRRRGTRRVLVLALLVGVVLAVQFGFFAVAQRFEEDIATDSRVQFAPMILAEAQRQAPAGTGLGGFRRAFEVAEGESPMPGLYVNHAHNDALELWLEAGWLLLPVALPLLVFFAWSGWRAWRGDPDEGAYALALRRIAWIAVLLVLLHSLGDYPLRTTAHLALLGLLAACTMRGARTDSAGGQTWIGHAS